jgi:hypothetical protein
MSRIDQRTARMFADRMPILAALLILASVASVSDAQAQAWPQRQQESTAWPQSSPEPQSNPWQQQQQQPPGRCGGFLPMKSEAEKTIAALNAAQKRKAPREEVCQLFKRLADATGKMATFLEQNKTQCGVPSEAITAVRKDHNKALGFQKTACSSAPAAQPSLSDVLGAPILPDSSTRPNMGTFDTLTGNPLIR